MGNGQAAAAKMDQVQLTLKLFILNWNQFKFIPLVKGLHEQQKETKPGQIDAIWREGEIPL